MSQHAEQINAILKGMAHSETNAAHQDLHQKLQQTQSAVDNGHGGSINWDDFEKTEVDKLDQKSHDAHVKAVHRIAEQGKQLPPDQQNDFMHAAMKGLQAFSDFMNNVFKKVADVISKAFAKISQAINDIIDWIKSLVDKVVGFISEAISNVTGWANSTAHLIEEWAPLVIAA